MVVEQWLTGKATYCLIALTTVSKQQYKYSDVIKILSVSIPPHHPVDPDEGQVPLIVVREKKYTTLL